MHLITTDKRGTCTIPWPTRDYNPVSEYTIVHFFILAFPCLFPYGSGDLFGCQRVYLNGLTIYCGMIMGDSLIINILNLLYITLLCANELQKKQVYSTPKARRQASDGCRP